VITVQSRGNQQSHRGSQQHDVLHARLIRTVVVDDDLVDDGLAVHSSHQLCTNSDSCPHPASGGAFGQMFMVTSARGG
jgi:hypothetical protein